MLWFIFFGVMFCCVVVCVCLFGDGFNWYIWIFEFELLMCGIVGLFFCVLICLLFKLCKLLLWCVLMYVFVFVCFGVLYCGVCVMCVLYDVVMIIGDSVFGWFWMIEIDVVGCVCEWCVVWWSGVNKYFVMCLWGEWMWRLMCDVFVIVG